MSILGQLLRGQITFGQAATEIEAWAQKLVTHDSALAGAAGAIMADVKQAASNAITMADSALADYLQTATAPVEGALDAALSAATHGISIPFNPFINDGIDRLAAAVKAEADAWALKAKAALVPPAT